MGRWLWIVLGCGCSRRELTAAEETGIPPLLPPRPEVPPGFWDQSGGWVLLGIAAVIALIFTITLLARKRQRELPPIEILIRDELERLRRVSADDRTLSRISRCVRRYFAVAFALPQEELTTNEFVRAAQTSSSIGTALSKELSDFLRECDEVKFAPEPPPGVAVHIEIASRALALVEQGESRRNTLRRESEAPVAASQQA